MCFGGKIVIRSRANSLWGAPADSIAWGLESLQNIVDAKREVHTGNKVHSVEGPTHEVRQ